MGSPGWPPRATTVAVVRVDSAIMTTAASPDPDELRMRGAWVAGTALLVGYLAVVALQLVAFALDRPRQAWPLLGGIAVAVALVALGPRAGRRAAAALALAATVAAALIAWRTYDVSWDGQWYHQEAVIRIARGWNVLREAVSVGPQSRAPWLTHYPKASWLFAAAVYQGVQRIEVAKLGTALLACASTLFAYDGARVLARLPRGQSALLALAVGANPIIASQLASFLVDGQMAAALTMAVIAGCASLVEPRRLHLVPFACALVVCMNLKFTGVVYAGVLVTALGAVCAYRWFVKGDRGAGRPATVAAVALMLGLMVGWNPYITNIKLRGHPFYPLFGLDKYPLWGLTRFQLIEWLETPKNLVGRNRVVKLAYGVFGRTANPPYRGGLNAAMKPLGALYPSELSYYDFADLRIGALGPWFGLALVAACALTGVGAFASRRNASNAAECGWCALLAGAVALAALANPEAWWLRYAPQLWLLPLILSFPWLVAGQRWMRIAAWAVITLQLANAAVVAAGAAVYAHDATRALAAQIEDLRQAPFVEANLKDFGSLRWRLEEAGIRVVEKRQLPCDMEYPLVSVNAGYPPGATLCVPHLQRP